MTPNNENQGISVDDETDTKSNERSEVRSQFNKINFMNDRFCYVLHLAFYG